MRYLIDTSAGRFTVQAFATGLLSAFGHNPTIVISDYEGKMEFAPEASEEAFVRVTVRTTAMEVLDDNEEG